MTGNDPQETARIAHAIKGTAANLSAGDTVTVNAGGNFHVEDVTAGNSGQPDWPALGFRPRELEREGRMALLALGLPLIGVRYARRMRKSIVESAPVA